MIFHEFHSPFLSVIASFAGPGTLGDEVNCGGDLAQRVPSQLLTFPFKLCVGSSLRCA